MIDLTKEHDGKFAIFSVSPLRYGEVSRVVNLVPHKWLIGQFEGTLELSALVPLADFLKRSVYLMEDQESYLELGPVNHRNGTRPADLVYVHGAAHGGGLRREHLPPFRQVNIVAPGQDFSFDPETGFYFATPPDERSVS